LIFAFETDQEILGAVLAVGDFAWKFTLIIDSVKFKISINAENTVASVVAYRAVANFTKVGSTFSDAVYCFDVKSLFTWNANCLVVLLTFSAIESIALLEAFGKIPVENCAWDALHASVSWVYFSLMV
jgi:hypothetical protein